MLGYTNPDVFEDPEFIKGVHALFDGLRKVQDEDVQKQFPDHMRMSVARVTTGEGLARIAYDANAYLFNADEAIASEAKELAASIFDFLRDLGDLDDDGSFADRLGYQSSLGELLAQLEATGAACYSGFAAASPSLISQGIEAMPITIGGVFLGSLGWWALLTLSACFLRQRLTSRALNTVSKCAAILMGYIAIRMIIVGLNLV